MRVPVYESRARSAALPTPTVRPAATGTDTLGAGLQRLGSAALDIVVKERDRADSFRVDSADLEMGRVLNEASWGNDGFLHQQGENALDYDARLQAVQQEAARISKALASDRQREMFRARTVARIEQTRGAWEKHSGGQRGVLFGQVAEGQAQLALDEAAANFADPDAVQSAVQKVLHDPDGGPGVLVRYLRDVKGLSQEAIERAVTQFRRQAYGGALRRHLDDEDVDGAKAFLERFGEAMGPEADKARKAIAGIEKKRQALRTADEIVAGARGGENGWVDETKALAAVDAIEDPEKKEKVRTAVRAALVDAGAAKKAEIDQRWKGALAAYNRGGLRAVPASTMDWLNRNAPELERKLRDDAEARWRRSKGDKAQARQEQRDANDAALRAFFEMSAQERSGTDLEDWAMGRGVDESGRLSLQRAKNSAADAVQKGDAAREDEFRRDGLAQAAGVVTSKEDVAALGAELTIAFNQFRDDHKRLPTREEAQKLQDELLTRAVTERSANPFSAKPYHLFGRDKEELAFRKRSRERQEALQSGERAGGSASETPGARAPAPSEVPAEIRERIIRDYRAKHGDGTQPTGQTISRAFEFGRREGRW